MSHAVVVLFSAEQAGPQNASFSISTPDTGTPSGVQVGRQPQNFPIYWSQATQHQTCHISHINGHRNSLGVCCHAAYG